MASIFKIYMIALLASAVTARAQTPVKSRSTPQLEERLIEIDSELEQLAHYSPRTGAGAIGYRSIEYSDPDHTEWVQIELEHPTPIDQIVLVPALARDMQVGFVPDGFPVQFQIITGTADQPNGTVSASFSQDDHLLPRIAPFIIPCTTTASWVRVEASQLSQRIYDGMYNFELAEIMVFNEHENVALRQHVTASSHIDVSSRTPRFIVDGFVPYVMNSGIGTAQHAYVAHPARDESPTIRIDLKRPYPVNRIHLHAVNVSDTAPQSFPSGYALPKALQVEGANQSDFSDAIRLTEYHIKTIYDSGPILTFRFPETRCRYIRLTALEPYLVGNPQESRIGFAEIELFSDGQNVALHNLVEGLQTFGYRPLSALTDGANIFGEILPVRQWMEELALRHDLEKERPLVASELNRRYSRQKETLKRMGWLASLLAAGIGFTFLIGRRNQHQKEADIRKRFAANLHDELGANLHAIGLLGDLAKDEIDSRNHLIEIVDRIRALTERTSAAARTCSDMLGSQGVCEDLVTEMKRSSHRLLADMDHEISFKGEADLQRLKPRKRIDLFLFYKECLVNILRHSGATRITTELDVGKKDLNMVITDNGCGLPISLKNGVPPSLKRRAQLMGGQVTITRSQEGGTCVRLHLRIRNDRAKK